jgi:arsenate reductase
MAEGLARDLFKGTARVFSVGSHPGKVNSFAIKAMNEINIDISTHHSKSIDSVLDQKFDYVITLCAEEVCPVLAGTTHKEHWPFKDPAAVSGSEDEILASFREVRDQIREKIEEFGISHNVLSKT